MRVEVYRNLRTGTLSVRDVSTGRVVDHPDVVAVRDVTFVVQPAGRRKVLETRQKNVHAFVRGTLTDVTDVTGVTDVEFDGVASYNPYRAGHFYDKASGEPLQGASAVVVSIEGVRYSNRS